MFFVQKLKLNHVLLIYAVTPISLSFKIGIISLSRVSLTVVVKTGFASIYNYLYLRFARNIVHYLWTYSNTPYDFLAGSNYSNYYYFRATKITILNTRTVFF